MSDSILSWMHTHETRYAKLKRQFNNIKSEDGVKNQQSTTFPEKKMKKTQDMKDAQVRLDNFMEKPRSEIFDEDFSYADFQLLTKQWKEKNLQNVAVN